MSEHEFSLSDLDQAEEDRAVFMALDGRLTGAELLDEVRTTLRRYVIFPSEQAADAATLYTAATHAQPSWRSASRFIAKSAEKRCGKSRLFEIMRELIHNPLPSVNISVAALVRSISETDPPTFVVDEADRLFGADRPSEATEIMIGILNAGFARGWPYIRWDVITRTREECPTFAMAMLASKGADLPDTIEDRGVVIVMRRKAPGENVHPFRERDKPQLHKLRARLRSWIEPHLKMLESAEPALPVTDRAADVWESLVAIADLAGDHWPQRARAAATFFTSQAEQDEDSKSLGIRLLIDIRELFHDFAVSFMKSTDLVIRLRKVDSAPWNDLELTTSSLASRLKLYGIRPGKNTAGTERGYQLEWFLDTFTRYLPPRARVDESEGVRKDADQGERPDTLDVSAGQDGHPESASGRPNPSEGVRDGRVRTPSDTLASQGVREGFSRSDGVSDALDGFGHPDPRERVADTRDADDSWVREPPDDLDDYAGWPPGSIGAEVNAPQQRQQPRRQTRSQRRGRP